MEEVQVRLVFSAKSLGFSFFMIIGLDSSLARYLARTDNLYPLCEKLIIMALEVCAQYQGLIRKKRENI